MRASARLIMDTLGLMMQLDNGITIIASQITKTMAGGGGTDFGTFHCENISVVNGAQTVGTIGRHIAKAAARRDAAPCQNVWMERAREARVRAWIQGAARSGHAHDEFPNRPGRDNP
jgi:hypothetical protein